MNVDNILATADEIERADHFDMSRFWEDLECKTPSCIAGHAAALAGGIDVKAVYEGSFVYPESATVDLAQRWLGLDVAQRGPLFWADPASSRSRAVRTLRHLARTGEVLWTA